MHVCVCVGVCVGVCGHETILKTSAPHSQRAGPDPVLLGLVAVQAVSGRATLAAAVAAAAAVAVC